MYSIVVAQTRACALASHSGTLCRDICSGPVLLRTQAKVQSTYTGYAGLTVYPFLRVATVYQPVQVPAYCVDTQGVTPRVRKLTSAHIACERRQSKDRGSRGSVPLPRESSFYLALRSTRLTLAESLWVSLPRFPANHPVLARRHSVHKSSQGRSIEVCISRPRTEDGLNTRSYTIHWMRPKDSHDGQFSL